NAGWPSPVWPDPAFRLYRATRPPSERWASEPERPEDDMATKELSDVGETMRDIDFCMLTTRREDGGLSARPMSNNRQVDFDGDSFFFSCGDTDKVREIAADPHVTLAFQGKQGLLGKPGAFIAVEG